MSDVEPRTEAVFRAIFSKPELKLARELTAFDIPGWDSIAHVRLVVALEKEFKIKFKTPEIVALKNVGGFLDLISTKLEKRA